MVSFIASLFLLFLLLLLWFSRSINERVFTVRYEKSNPLSTSVELKSVSVVSLKFASVGREWNVVSILTVGDASSNVFALSGMFVKVNGWFSALWFSISLLLWSIFSF